MPCIVAGGRPRPDLCGHGQATLYFTGLNGKPTMMLDRRKFLREAAGATVVGLAPAPALAASALPIKIANAAGAMTQVMQALMRQQGYLESFGLKPETLEVQ